MKIKQELSPSEFFDKLTILVNKVYHCKTDKDVTLAIFNLVTLCQSVKKDKYEEYEEICNLLTDLRDTNKSLWELEELVRGSRAKEKEEYRLELSDNIRSYNASRSKIKNSIDDKMHFTSEVKDYTTSM